MTPTRQRRLPEMLGLAATLLIAAIALAGASGSAIDSRRYLQHLQFLASDDLQGRGNGSPGLDKAAEYIARQFRAAGLEPGGDKGTYFQGFEIVTGLEVGSGNALSLGGPRGAATLALGRDYYPLSVTAGQSRELASLPLVFAGYGISAPSLGYDDYASVDVRGKAVLIFTHEPQENDRASRFDGQAHTAHAAVMNKAMTARGLGAGLVLLVEDPAHAAESASYGGFLRDPQADELGVPVVRVRRDRVIAALGPAIDLSAAGRDIDADLTPRSRELSGMSVRLAEQFNKIRRPVRNVVGLLEGADASRAREAVVVGAHYDHLGLGGRHSLAPDAAGQVHNGADDNASGTAALLEIARAAAADRGRFPRTVVFVAFAGEELGLLGSAHYVNHPAVPIEQTVAMVNLDMIGRPSGRVMVSGLDSAPALLADLKAAQAGVPLDVKEFREGSGVGSSDDTSFIVRRVPSIGFFSGFHGDYHRPGDDWQKIDAAGASAVAEIALALTRRIADRGDRPEFVATAAQAPTSSPSASAASGAGYGPYFGSVPDFGDETEGVKLADVREGSPAAKAGFQRGDVIVSFAGAPIKTLYDFTFALRNRRPGDVVDVTVIRNGERITKSVQLTSRSQ